MPANNKSIKSEGRVFITFFIETKTGMHIGGSDTEIEIGGIDKAVIRNTQDDRPYIPGSSLKGKIRSLLDKYHNLPINYPPRDKAFHNCQDRDKYINCNVCQVFGISGQFEFTRPTRLIVRDIFMSENSAKELQELQTDLPYTEVKTEVSIDRVTSAANPRQMERVPAGTIFGDDEQPAEMIYSIYSGDDCDAGKDIDRLQTLVEGMQLLEEDYLGGLGSRGSGKVEIKNIQVSIRKHGQKKAEVLHDYPGVNELLDGLTELQTEIKKRLNIA